jgi:HSP20 family protein
MFQRFFNESPLFQGHGDAHTINMDAFEEDGAYKIVAEVPGFDEEDIHVHVDNDMLTVEVDQEQSAESDGKEWSRREIQRTYTSRSVRLPDTIDNPDDVTATLEKGMLTITCPSMESSDQSRKRTIDIQ